MSEYQYYEFLALDQPLTDQQLLEVRAFSTRARITPTSFVNEHHWGNFRGNIDTFMTKYYDAFVYVANWSTHDLRFRLPKAGLDLGLAKQYCRSHGAHLRLAGNHAVLSLSSEDESGDWEEGEDDEAVHLLRDLRDLANREGKASEAAPRLRALRDAHSGKPSLIRRLDLAGL